MDRALDDVIAGRPRGPRGQRGGRRNNNSNNNNNTGFPRDGVRKSAQRDNRDLDQDWVHDRYDDDDEREPARPRRGGGGFRSDRQQNRSPAGRAGAESGFKLKVENLHYEITEEDLKELFSRIGRVQTASLVYDRQDRSTGVAYVAYAHLEDALKALNEFNGQKAYDQPIYLTMLPSKDGTVPAARRDGGRDADSSRPTRSLFDRIENPVAGGRRGRGRDRRSLSPERPVRHSDVSKPAPENIDRYVPGQRNNNRNDSRNDSRRRSPARRGAGGGRGGGGQGRRPGARREQSRKDDSGRPMVQGRPRKTQEELDAEMDDYWNQQGDSQSQANTSNGNNAPANGTNAATTAPAGGDDDIDMIE